MQWVVLSEDGKYLFVFIFLRVRIWFGQENIMAIFAKIANFAKIAIFAKIASLQGATFGIQFKSPAAGDFSPVSPFSPLHAFLDISGKYHRIGLCCVQ